MPGKYVTPHGRSGELLEGRENCRPSSALTMDVYVLRRRCACCVRFHQHINQMIKDRHGEWL
jgi:hypothetical protein